MVLLLFCTGCSSSETENSQEDVNEPPVVEVTDFTEHGKFSDPTPEPDPIPEPDPDPMPEPDPEPGPDDGISGDGHEEDMDYHDNGMTNLF